MHRRGDELSGRLLPALLVSLFGIGALVLAAALLVVVTRDSSDPVELATVPVSTPIDSQLVESADDGSDGAIAPSDTVTEFYPESANLSDCVGLVEKPGCGSGSRGGWHQTAVFVVLFAGLGVVLWRVSRGIRANRAVLDAEITADADADADADSDSGSDVDADRS